MRLLALLTFASTLALAQNQPLTNVASGESVSIRDFKGAKAVVIIFTSNVCAYDAYYVDRLRTLFATYGANVQFLLVNPYLEPEETEDKMKSKYHLWAFNVPYLADKNQDWMKALGAKKSPEVFVMDPNATVIYHGAIDDNPQLANGVKEFYLKKVLDGQKIADTRATGCSIRSK